MEGADEALMDVQLVDLRCVAKPAVAAGNIIRVSNMMYWTHTAVRGIGSPALYRLGSQLGQA